MLTSEALRKLASLNLSAEQMSGVLSILADNIENEEKRKENQAARKRRSRDSHGTVTRLSRDISSPLVPPSDGFPNPSFTPPYNPPITKNLTSVRQKNDFNRWYDRYPHKVGKADATKKFMIALTKASLEELIAGLDRYIATKPPDRAYCNPATWLHQERWKDQPSEIIHHANPSKPYASNSHPSKTDRLNAAALRVAQRYGFAPGQQLSEGVDDNALSMFPVA